MQLKRSWEYGARAQRRYSVSEAVEATCLASDSDVGTLENLRAAQNATAALLGAVVQALEEDDTLPPLTVLGLLSGFERAPAEEPRT